MPRGPLSVGGRVWLVLAALTAIVFGLLLSPTDFVLGRGAFWDGIDNEIIKWVARGRSDLLTVPAKWLNVLTDPWLLRIVRWAVVAALLWFKRWRHLFAFVGLILLFQPLVLALSYRMARPRVDHVDILTRWSEFSAPSLPLAALTITLLGTGYALVVKGRGRRRFALAAAATITLVGVARIYLAADRMTDGLSGAVLATGASIVMFRLWAPDAVFPVSYSRRRVAHLELNELRRNAIFNALQDQLGLRPVAIELFGLEASGGSTPLLITLDHGDPPAVFAKLYAQNHLRSDRWYKLGRSLLYGALEDESPFRVVRALAEHEDYIMRLMAAASVPAPTSYGIVEITPGREYLLVTEFIENASEISHAEVDEDVIDGGLAAVRTMWDAGLAHRDIKPGNVLVRGRNIFLIDAAFGETRPSPWREAVDLANMMLTLSLRSSPDRVYGAALKYFTQAEVAEALAATRSVTIPSELRRAIKADPRDVVSELRGLALAKAPIRIQRWTRRRLGLLGSAAMLSLITVWLVVVNLAFVGKLL